MDMMDGDPERWVTTSARGLDCSGWGKPEVRGSFKPPPDNGLPDSLSKQTARGKCLSIQPLAQFPKLFGDFACAHSF